MEPPQVATKYYYCIILETTINLTIMGGGGGGGPERRERERERERGRGRERRMGRENNEIPRVLLPEKYPPSSSYVRLGRRMMFRNAPCSNEAKMAS